MRAVILFLTGASHTGKTLLAQRLLERHRVPYLSIDHLKMGLIRSGETALTPEDDAALEAYLWPIVREIARTALENRQHLILEGGYILFRWREDFTDRELREIRFCCLAMTRDYIEHHFADIRRYADVIERRLDDSGCTPAWLIAENERCRELCRRYDCPCLLIDGEYRVDLDGEDLFPPVEPPRGAS